MKIISLHIYHDMSFCIYDSDKCFFRYFKAERILNQKHFGLGMQGNIHIDSKNTLNQCYVEIFKNIIKESGFSNPDVVVIIDNDYWFRSNNYSNNNYEYVVNFDKKSKKYSILHFLDSLGIKTNNLFFIGHHYSHILSGFPILDYKKCSYGVCIDGQGNNLTVSFFEDPFGDISQNKRYYTLENENISSIGHSFNLFGKKMKLSGYCLDFSGKVMGAQSYGKIDLDYIKGLDIDFISKNFYNYTTDILKKYSDVFFNFENSEFKDLLSTWHKIAELCVLNLFEKNIKEKNSHIIYSGGVVQNTVINESLSKIYPNLYFTPHGYDGGLSLGGLYAICNYEKIKIPEINNFPYLQSDEVKETPTEKTIKYAAKLLADGKIVGWHQGAGEIGPRSLGNRSILMDPGIFNAKEILNNKIKKRESWRPYAASVLLDYAHDWFDFEGDSPYMMRAIKAIKEKKSIIKSVVHEDDTCRIQTVSKYSNLLFYKLIYEFYNLRGIPMLLNTSLNIAGKPISGDPATSKLLYNSSEMDCLIVGNKIYNKQKKTYL